MKSRLIMILSIKTKDCYIKQLVIAITIISISISISIIKHVNIIRRKINAILNDGINEMMIEYMTFLKERVPNIIILICNNA